MRAYVLHGVGDLRYEEVPTPTPDPGSALVRVVAAGICGSDIPRIYKTGAYTHPLIPGHEFSGVVVEVGSSVNAGWVGRRVGVFPLIPCQTCEQCRKKQYEMCRGYSYLGSRTDGGFAEYVRVPVWNLLELPDQISFAQAAMLEPMAVAVHAIRRAEIAPEDSMAVCGLGTIGLLMTMALLGMGYERLYVIGSKDIQSKMIADLGIPRERFCDIREQDAEAWLQEVSGGHGADVFFDCVGKNEVLEEAIRSASAGGKIVLVGNPASDLTLDQKVYWQVLRKQLILIGTWNSSFVHEVSDDWHYALQLMQRGEVQPERLITRKLNMPELYKGMECMRDKTEEFVKIMGLAAEICESGEGV